MSCALSRACIWFGAKGMRPVRATASRKTLQSITGKIFWQCHSNASCPAQARSRFEISSSGTEG